MPEIKDILYSAKQELEALGIATPELDAELLLAHTLGIDKNLLFIGASEEVQDSAFMALLERRKKFEPIAYIIGHKEFWGLEFKVTPDTLIPRPDSETVIELVLEQFPDKNAPYKILDLGTGTGCLGLSLLSEYKNATATLTDLSVDALEVAQFNTETLGMAQRTKLLQSNWFGSLGTEKYDIIVCNPPYIEASAILAPDVALYEPHSALFGQEDGYAAYKEIAKNLANFLKPEGMAFFEFGQGQENGVSDILVGAGLRVIGIRKDLAGIDRVVAVVLYSYP